MKKLWIVLVILGVMMGAAWNTCAAGVEDLDLAVIRARQTQYTEAAYAEPRLDISVVRGRQGLSPETASAGEPRLDVAVIRARQGQYCEVAHSEPRLDIVVIRARQHQFVQAAAAGLATASSSP